MGTRHLIAVQLNGEYKIAQYGQWNGYPEGQGIGVLDFISSKDNLKKLKESLSRVRFIDEVKDKSFIEDYDRNAPEWSDEPDNRTDELKRWFNTYISRDIGSRILENVALSKDHEILLQNRIDFAADSLFCEFAYVIDFDKNKFEIYKGFNKSPIQGEHRFSGLNPNDDSEYYPVTLINEYDLDNLPDNKTFILDLTDPEDDTE